MLTSERLRELLCYDPLTGIFTRRVATGRWGRSPAGTVIGAKRPDGYVQVSIGKKQYLAHRLAWLYLHEEWPTQDIDHIDGDPSHNWIENLRLATRSENMQNRRGAQKNSRSGVLGVSWDASRQKWAAAIANAGQRRRLGRFSTQEQAQAAYETAKREFHPFRPSAP